MRISDWSSDVCSSDLIKAGTIPAARVGRQWRFVEAELVAWIRSGYPDAARTQPGASRKEAIWHSGNVHRNTMSSSQHRTERELDALLERPTGGRPRNNTRSEEGRVGKEGGGTCKTRRS